MFLFIVDDVIEDLKRRWIGIYLIGLLNVQKKP